MLKGNWTPRARGEALSIEEVGDELLVYDLDSDRAHCLGPTATLVWRACDGSTRSDALAAQLGLDAAQVLEALEQLVECELVPPAPDGVSRRDLSVKLFRGAAVVAASAPLIVSIAAPAPAQALTPVAFCAQFTSQGCGKCRNGGCCCCDPGGGNTKNCVPNEAFCQRVFGGNCSAGA